jgi:dUTP pyrophosphatase
MSKTVFFKRADKSATTPVYATEESRGADVTAVSREYSVNDAGVPIVVYDTGIALQPGKTHTVLLLPNSRIGKDVDLRLANSIGLIDNDYRGTLKMVFHGAHMPAEERRSQKHYQVGDVIGQILIITPSGQRPTFSEREKLDETKRGTGGFGSTKHDEEE